MIFFFSPESLSKVNESKIWELNRREKHVLLNQSVGMLDLSTLNHQQQLRNWTAKS